MTLTHRILTKPGYKILLVAALMATGMTVDYNSQIAVKQHPITVEQTTVVIPPTK